MLGCQCRMRSPTFSLTSLSQLGPQGADTAPLARRHPADLRLPMYGGTGTGAPGPTTWPTTVSSLATRWETTHHDHWEGAHVIQVVGGIGWRRPGRGRRLFKQHQHQSPSTTASTKPPVTAVLTTKAPTTPASTTLPPTTPATAPPTTAAAAACTPLTDSGKCYEPGEYCRASDHGMTGVAEDGEKIQCVNNDGWRWEPIPWGVPDPRRDGLHCRCITIAPPAGP